MLQDRIIICASFMILATVAAVSGQYLSGPGNFYGGQPLPYTPYGPTLSAYNRGSITDSASRDPEKDIESEEKKNLETEIKEKKEIEHEVENAGPRGPLLPPPPPPPPGPAYSEPSNVSKEEAKEEAKEEKKESVGVLKSFQNSMSDAWRGARRAKRATVINSTDKESVSKPTAPIPQASAPNAASSVAQSINQMSSQSSKPRNPEVNHMSSRSLDSSTENEEKHEYVYLKVPKYLICSN